METGSPSPQFLDAGGAWWEWPVKQSCGSVPSSNSSVHGKYNKLNLRHLRTRSVFRPAPSRGSASPQRVSEWPECFECAALP